MFPLAGEGSNYSRDDFQRKEDGFLKEFPSAGRKAIYV